MSALRFTELPRPSRVVFGAGQVAEVGEEVSRLDRHRVCVVTTPGRKALGERAADALGERCAGVHAEAIEHVPGGVADAGVARARELDADGCVAVGGGSAIGLGKAIAPRHRNPACRGADHVLRLRDDPGLGPPPRTV